MKVSKSAYIV